MGLAVLFPGQGTQFPRMGEPWRETPAWALVERAEAAVDLPLAHLLLEADADQLARTRDAQLAVLLTSLMAWEAVRDSVEAPIAFAGHSLGQITALIASGALTLEDGVRVAAERAGATQAAADARPGRMAALIGATLEQAQAACGGTDGRRAARPTCWVANDNAPGQVVLGGTPEGIEQAIARAPDLGIRRVIPLNVGAAFHTPLMAPAADRPGAVPGRHTVRGTDGPGRVEHRRRPPPRRRRLARAPHPSPCLTGPLARVDADARRPRGRHVHRGRPRQRAVRAGPSYCPGYREPERLGSRRRTRSLGGRLTWKPERSTASCSSFPSE